DLAHGLTLVRTVVEEQEAVEPEIELGGELADVLGLWVPVDGGRCKVVRPQYHSRVAVENGDGIGVVLAETGEEHALPLQPEAFLLERAEGIARKLRTADQRVEAVIAI